MKRFFQCLMIVLVLCLFAVSAMAASSVAWSSRRHMGHDGKEWLEITATFTCHTDGSFTTTALYESEAAETAGTIAATKGFYLHSVSYYYGATGALDNSDLTLLEHSASGYDVLVGAGTNIIDNATNNFTTTLIGTIPCPVPIFGNLYMAIANNNVNGATGAIIFKFVQ